MEPNEPGQKWSVAAAQLSLAWHREQEAERANARRDNRPMQSSVALTNFMTATRPHWPAADREKFIHVHAPSLLRLLEDPMIEAELDRRGYSPANRRIVGRLIRDLKQDVRPDGSCGAWGVIAGLIERQFGPEARVAYIVDTLLDPSLEDDLEDYPAGGPRNGPMESSGPTPFESRLLRLLNGAGTALTVLSGTAVALSLPGQVKDLIKYGPSDYLLMASVPGSANSHAARFLGQSILWLVGGIVCLLVGRYLRGRE